MMPRKRKNIDSTLASFNKKSFPDPRIVVATLPFPDAVVREVLKDIGQSGKLAKISIIELKKVLHEGMQIYQDDLHEYRKPRDADLLAQFKSVRTNLINLMQALGLEPKKPPYGTKHNLAGIPILAGHMWIRLRTRNIRKGDIIQTFASLKEMEDCNKARKQEADEIISALYWLMTATEENIEEFGRRNKQERGKEPRTSLIRFLATFAVKEFGWEMTVSFREKNDGSIVFNKMGSFIVACMKAIHSQLSSEFKTNSPDTKKLTAIEPAALKQQVARIRSKKLPA